MRAVVKRHLCLLKTLLPHATLAASVSKAPSDAARDGARDVHGVIGDIFDMHPALITFQLRARITDVLKAQKDESDTLAERVVKVTPVYGFRVSVPGGHFDVEDIWGQVDLLGAIWSEKAKEKFPEEVLKQVHGTCKAVLTDFEEVRALCESSQDFWRSTRQVSLTREQWQMGLLGGNVDVDALRALTAGLPTAVLSRQMDLSGPPAYWNAATIASIPQRLSAGMDPHACDSEGLSALVAASTMKERQLVDLLLQAGADPDRVDCTGFNAATAALAVNSTDLFHHLVKAGANPGGPQTLPTVLVALHTPHPVGTLQAAIEAGADTRITLPDGVRFDSAIYDLGSGSAATFSELSALARSRATELEVQEAFGHDNLAAQSKKSKSSLAL